MAISSVTSPITKQLRFIARSLYVRNLVSFIKAFFKTFNLKAHKRVYTGHEPFACSFPKDGKRFKWALILTFHKVLHLKEVD